MPDHDAHDSTDAQPHGVDIAPGIRVPAGAIDWSFARSSGPGGQNVNRRATKVQLRIGLSVIENHIGAEAAQRLRRRAGTRLTSDDAIVIQADTHRTQQRNRDACLQRLRELIIAARVKPKRRIRTKPSAGARQRRLDAKKHRGWLKSTRRRPAQDG